MSLADDLCLPVHGVRLAAATAGMYDHRRHDLALFEFAPTSISSAVFTKNKFLAAPVIIARDRISRSSPRYLLINAGNANAGTGDKGLDDARQICQVLADLVDTDVDAVLPFSTGVIGEYLPTDNIIAQLKTLVKGLSEDNWLASAHAIMTTDTQAKYCSRQLEIDGQTVTISGIAKGAGMIKPDMATMLAFICTDAVVAPTCLDAVLAQSVANTFNRICVDGDTSTNDACILTATRRATNTEIQPSHPACQSFADAIEHVCRALARAIIKDAEGATKFVTVKVTAGKSALECKNLAFLLASSPLVKTALYASDPNWGRLLAVVGRADISDLAIDRVRIYLGEICVVENGGRCHHYTEQQGQRIMQTEDITITVELNRGSADYHVWTCDFSHEYVTINAAYRT